MKLVYATIIFLLLLGAYYLGSVQGEQSEQHADTSSLAEETKATPLVYSDGSYAVVPLEKDVVVLKVIQTRVKSVGDFPSVEAGLEENISYMEEMGTKACTQGKKPDFILFHEFPLTGYSPGSRKEKLKFTVEIPGPETQRLGKLAMRCDSYIIFGSYVRDSQWPDHILSINTVINREGEVVKEFWKSRNIKRLYPDREITTTTIEAVRDQYRQTYGIEEEFPVLRTEFGNIAVSTVQFDPFIFAAFAMRGTEIMLRTATLFAEEDVVYTAWTNNFYSAMANFTLPPEGKYSAGESIIVSPKGKLLAKHPSTSEDGIIEAEIPIAEFRKGRKIPNYALEMTKPVFAHYKQEIPINHLAMPAEELPQTGEQMKELFDRVSRYLNPR